MLVGVAGLFVVERTITVPPVTSSFPSLPTSSFSSKKSVPPDTETSGQSTESELLRTVTIALPLTESPAVFIPLFELIISSSPPVN